MNWIELAFLPDNFFSLLQGACFTSVLMSHLHSSILLTLLILCVCVYNFLPDSPDAFYLLCQNILYHFYIMNYVKLLSDAQLIILFTIKMHVWKYYQQCLRKFFHAISIQKTLNWTELNKVEMNFLLKNFPGPSKC